jgi:hypothetical protein
VGTERAGAAQDRPEVAGIGDLVEGDQQRWLEPVLGDLQELVDVRVLVGRDRQADALVDGMTP